ncbi:MAG: Fic family protein [Deltaproteobacteria bacterium]|nr:Fic family protein [Deltaproteobacteria bacterium]
MIEKFLQKRLDEKFAAIRKLRPLPPVAVTKLKEQFAIELTYNSNAIEGNKLTLKETYLVISEGITVKGKPLKDHLEATDHYEAIHFLYELIERDKKHTVSENLIRSLQQLVVSESDPKVAGSYRSGNVFITGSKHTASDAQDIPELMHKLVLWLRKNLESMHPVELAAVAHHRLVHIHPFFDGNGRTARLFMNLILLREGYPLVVILKNDRKKYYHVLEKADSGDAAPLVRFVAQAVERSMNIYLKVLLPAKTKGRFLPLSTIAQQTPYSEKYLNLLARYGRIEAHKEGRIWLTSLQAISGYQESRLRKRIPKKKN